MATEQFSVTSEAYKQIGVSGDLIENRSSYPIRVVFSDRPPRSDELNYHFVKGGNRFPDEKSGTLVGNMYAKCHRESSVSVIMVTPSVSNPESGVSDPTQELIALLKQGNKYTSVLGKDTIDQMRLLNMQLNEAFETDLDENDIRKC